MRQSKLNKLLIVSAMAMSALQTFIYYFSNLGYICIQNDGVHHNEDEIESFIEQIDGDKAESRVEGNTSMYCI